MSLKVGANNNIPKSMVGAWIGGASNTPKKILNAWIGNASNVPKLFYTAEAPHGEQVFTSSGTFTVPSGVSKIDIFCVGGAGGMCNPSSYDREMNASGTSYCTYFGYDDEYGDGYANGNRQDDSKCAQGGSGYTHTELQVSVTSGETLVVSVGALGSKGQGKYTLANSSGGTEYEQSATAATDGGTSGVYRGSTGLCTASGGKKASTPDPASYSYPTTSTNYPTKGGDGGSGGRSAGFGWLKFGNSGHASGSFGKITECVNGSNGGNPVPNGVYKNFYSDTEQAWTFGSQYLSSGQGSTTKAFGESSGTLYDNFGEAGTVIIRW